METGGPPAAVGRPGRRRAHRPTPTDMLVLALLLLGTAVGVALHRLGMPGLASWAGRMRVGLSLALLFVGVDHLLTPERYLPMMPDVVPAPGTVVLLTGLAEIAGAIGLHLPRLRRATGILLALYFLAVLPANVKVALEGRAVAGLPSSPAYYLLRLALQPVFVWWALASAEVVRLPRRSGGRT